MTEAEIVFNKAVHRTFLGFGKITTPRKTAELCMNVGIEEVTQYSKYLVDEYLFDPKLMNEEFAEEFLQKSGGIEKYGRDSAIQFIGQLESFIDNSSLVFAHSILDDILLDYCKASALADYTQWLKFVKEKKIPLGDFIQNDLHVILHSKVQEYVANLERDSLMVKNDKLFEVCKIDDTFKPPRDYQYDRKRLAELDKLRHDIVHKSDETIIIPDINNDLWYLQQTAVYYMSMVIHAFGLNIDPENLMSHFTKSK